MPFDLYPILKFQQWQNPRSCIPKWFPLVASMCPPPNIHDFTTHTHGKWETDEGPLQSVLEPELLKHKYCNMFIVQHAITFAPLTSSTCMYWSRINIWNPAGKLPSPFASMFDILCLHSFATWTDTGFKENTRGLTRSPNPYYEKRPLPRILCLDHNNFIGSPAKTAMEVQKEQFIWFRNNVREWSIKGRDNK